jgi:hypothetical protein
MHTEYDSDAFLLPSVLAFCGFVAILNRSKLELHSKPPKLPAKLQILMLAARGFHSNLPF